jgi:ribosome-binding ATPase
MKIGLVGFPGSGKTTVFNTMTGLDVPVGFGGEVRLGTVRVPDARIDELAGIFKPKKTTFAEMTFCDVPGEHGSQNKGLSPRGLQQIRDQEALALVLRGFKSDTTEGEPDPMGELESFHAECIFADLETVERRLERAKKDKAAPNEIAGFEAMKNALENEKPIRSLSPEELDRQLLRGYALLTDKPLLVVVNQGEDKAAEPLSAALAKRIDEITAAGLTLSASVEAEIASLPPEDQAAFLADLGLEASALSRFIRTAYGLLDLIAFFTVGPDEVRAWTIRRGSSARKAAGRIHSDLERGFIRAEVIPYDVFMTYGSENAVKDAGKMQVEGKEYVVGDGDILHVRFNV